MKAVAIDGPAGAGKSTIAKEIAKELGYIYVDTGALYRAVGLYAKKCGVPVEEVAYLLDKIEIQLKFIDGEQKVFLNGEDASEEIRSPDIAMAASAVSAISAVRNFLFSLQKNLAKKNNVVMDGRDIGTVVLPKADVKIFLTASAEDRAKRRYEQYLKKGVQVDYEELLTDIKQRDYNDSHRKVAPLKQAEDAILVDTTGNTLEKSIGILKALIIERLGV